MARYGVGAGWGTVKPPPGTGINWAHPLAQGLMFVQYGGPTNIPVVGHRVRPTLNGAVGPVGNRTAGIGGFTTSSDSVAWAASTNVFGRAWANQGWTVAHIATSSTGTFYLSTLDNARTLTGAGGSNRMYGLNLNVSNGCQFYCFAGNGSIAVNFNGSSAVNMQDGNPHMLSAVMDWGSANKAYIYQDGLQRTSASNASGGVARAASGVDTPFIAGTEGAATGNTLGYTAMWGRALSPGEHLRLYAEPYGFFNPPGMGSGA